MPPGEGLSFFRPLEQPQAVRAADAPQCLQARADSDALRLRETDIVCALDFLGRVAQDTRQVSERASPAVAQRSGLPLGEPGCHLRPLVVGQVGTVQLRHGRRGAIHGGDSDLARPLAFWVVPSPQQYHLPPAFPDLHYRPRSQSGRLTDYCSQTAGTSDYTGLGEVASS